MPPGSSLSRLGLVPIPPAGHTSERSANVCWVGRVLMATVRSKAEWRCWQSPSAVSFERRRDVVKRDAIGAARTSFELRPKGHQTLRQMDTLCSKRPQEDCIYDLDRVSL
uniref:Uncharacterized protein n=1 Tax=Steinernema glaseri TaxID=37863 RepID=A0A1I7ZBR8_9BILA